ncbi:hypothetical protein E2C01_067773 [Portunus trituberculatus]|uniref:Uncharacterized protein n=1 Tax=Portunus trituberculatus TaxID=210409 RepID=A0A5B7HYB1_PORTR|nr:hypothetical protein [Portunus trituberculatus]
MGGGRAAKVPAAA